MSDDSSPRTHWTFLTNHARVLAAVARDPGVRLRDVAAECRLTERSVQAIVADLEAAGYLTRSRSGRRNTYRVEYDAALRHPADSGKTVRELLANPETPVAPVSQAAPATQVPPVAPVNPVNSLGADADGTDALPGR